ncbi:MAG: hypothetical protein LAT81_16280, partial [Oceanicaulis sp.]|nr:hypothetical protein [Oceanicaulis sp.]
MAAAAPDPEAVIASLAGDLGEAAQRVGNFRPLIDDAQFEIMPAIEGLDYEGEQIVRFVTEEVHFDPYAGILRGPQATLSARAGNAMDQSLLLLHLLEQAGYDAQIVMVERTPESLAAPLAAAAVAARSQAAPVRNADEARARIAELAEASGRTDAPDNAVAAFEQTALAGIDQAIRSVGSRLEEELTLDGGRVVEHGAYHWVRYRMASGMSWIHAHPALGGYEPDDLSPDVVLTGDAPEEMLHFLTIEMEAEILERGSLRRTQVMSPWRQPVASLFDTPISIALVVDRAGTDNEAGAAFLPVFNGALPPGAMMVTLSGAVLDGAVAGMDSYGMSGIFSALGDQLQDGAQLVSGGSEDQPVRATTGLILRITWTAPDGRERVEERWILDRLVNRFAEGEAPRLDLSLTRSQALDRLSFQRDFIVNPGGAHGTFALARTLEAYGDRLELLSAVLNEAIENEGRIENAPPMRQTLQPFLLSMLDSLDRPLALPEGTNVHRHGPLIVSTHRHQPECEGLDDYIDVIFNPWSGMRQEGEALVAWPEGSILRGVHDTAAEVAFGRGDPDGDYLARSGDAPLRFINEPADVSNWPQDSRLAAEHDLSQGFVLAAIANGGGPELWWRISADGAETLGRHAMGGYSPLTERAFLDRIILAGDIVSWGLLGAEAVACTQSESGWPMACCYVSLAASFAWGWGAGNLIMGSAADAAATTAITTGGLLAGLVLQLSVMAASEAVGHM